MWFSFICKFIHSTKTHCFSVSNTQREAEIRIELCPQWSFPREWSGRHCSIRGDWWRGYHYVPSTKNWRWAHAPKATQWLGQIRAGTQDIWSSWQSPPLCTAGFHGTRSPSEPLPLYLGGNKKLCKTGFRAAGHPPRLSHDRHFLMPPSCHGPPWAGPSRAGHISTWMRFQPPWAGKTVSYQVGKTMWFIHVKEGAQNSWVETQRINSTTFFKLEHCGLTWTQHPGWKNEPHSTVHFTESRRAQGALFPVSRPAASS